MCAISSNSILGCPCCKPAPIVPDIQYHGVYVNNKCVHVDPTEKGALKHAQKLIEARVDIKKDESTATEFKVSVEKVDVTKKGW